MPRVVSVRVVSGVILFSVVSLRVGLDFGFGSLCVGSCRFDLLSLRVDMCRFGLSFVSCMPRATSVFFCVCFVSLPVNLAMCFCVLGGHGLANLNFWPFWIGLWQGWAPRTSLNMLVSNFAAEIVIRCTRGGQSGGEPTPGARRVSFQEREYTIVMASSGRWGVLWNW